MALQRLDASEGDDNARARRESRGFAIILLNRCRPGVARRSSTQQPEIVKSQPCSLRSSLTSDTKRWGNLDPARFEFPQALNLPQHSLGVHNSDFSSVAARLHDGICRLSVVAPDLKPIIRNNGRRPAAEDAAFLPPDMVLF